MLNWAEVLMSSGYVLSPSYAGILQLLLSGLLTGLTLHLFSSWPQRTATFQFDAIAKSGAWQWAFSRVFYSPTTVTKHQEVHSDWAMPPAVMVGQPWCLHDFSQMSKCLPGAVWVRWPCRISLLQSLRNPGFYSEDSHDCSSGKEGWNLHCLRDKELPPVLPLWHEFITALRDGLRRELIFGIGH